MNYGIKRLISVACILMALVLFCVSVLMFSENAWLLSIASLLTGMFLIYCSWLMFKQTRD